MHAVLKEVKDSSPPSKFKFLDVNGFPVELLYYNQMYAKL